MKRIISIILVVVLAVTSLLTLSSCGEETIGVGVSYHYGVRETKNRGARYVKMAVRGYGSMIILLEERTAPVTVNNFLALANSGFYDGLTFHRVVSNFMIQGGDPDANGTGGSDTNIFGEFIKNGHYNDLSHKRGTISMARSTGYNSASSQFFICNADASDSLDGSYAAFGYVILGMSVVDKITKKTVAYANSSSGTIERKSKQAVISYVREITEKEALSYIQN